jgi:hemerythrin-like domain-containing protein
MSASDRRAFLTMAGAGLLVAACRKDEPAATRTTSAQVIDVGAVEDLMREHGVIRRTLVVYRESAARLRTKRASVAPDQLQRAARLIRSFAEDYHEKLEEQHLFPAVKKAGGLAAAEIDTLLAQHRRGREITDFVLAVTAKTLAAQNAESLAKAMEGFARMYEEHAAREDTIVFPAWKKAMSPTELDEMGDRFEAIEHETFGEDGFDDAVDRIAAIEKALGIDPGAMTAPPPPKT